MIKNVGTRLLVLSPSPNPIAACYGGLAPYPSAPAPRKPWKEPLDSMTQHHAYSCRYPCPHHCQHKQTTVIHGSSTTKAAEEGAVTVINLRPTQSPAHSCNWQVTVSTQSAMLQPRLACQPAISRWQPQISPSSCKDFIFCNKLNLINLKHGVLIYRRCGPLRRNSAGAAFCVVDWRIRCRSQTDSFFTRS